ncbi:serine/threonine-protein kinase [Streptomyces sp. NBRC 110611]|uniref:DUF4232 domain-containing protein n=1 Tax=Streptomyces sp. NBRC 110611 TaxID=1621259 RepID=UPI000835AA43|nr:DUF4232 domain-containing protein [Streptomyces sp. NBRC 110611]GAU70447.1 serine/threonine-protein kinase [Streptomyces sp. NBRC 110611]
MSLTTRTPGRGRRVAAGSLIAVAALTLTACQDGTTGAASRPSSAAAPATSQDGAQQEAQGGTRNGVRGGTEPTGAKDRPSSAAAEQPSANAAPSGGSTSSGTPNATESHASSMTASDRCTAADMSLRLGDADIGAGNIRYPLVFTNKGKKACTLRGFPGVSLIKRDGSSVGAPATREGGRGEAVRLQPGQSAYSVLHTLNDGVSDTPCWAESQLVFVYPPGSKESMTTGSHGLRVCGGRFDVTAVTPGSPG